MTGTTGRRSRPRAELVAEIVQTARRQLVRDGPAGISLRAIARELGLTAPALYRYFPSLDALIGALVADLYDELRGALEQAMRPLPADAIGRRLNTASHAFRAWAIEHPAEFAAVFGSPVLGVHRTASSRAEAPLGSDLVEGGVEALPDQAGRRFGALFADLFVQLWQRHRFPTPDPERLHPALRDQLDAFGATLGGVLPAEAVYVYLSCWMRLYGAVTMEVFGHLSFALSDGEHLFTAELDRIARDLRL